MINNKKSEFNPKTKGKCLGRINFYSSTGKNYKTFRGYNHVFKSRVIDPKTIIEGSRTTFFHLAIAPLGRFFTRNILFHRKISCYEQKLVIKNVKEELKFWPSNINIYNGYTFKPRPLTYCLLFTDASDKVHDGFVLKH